MATFKVELNAWHDYGNGSGSGCHDVYFIDADSVREAKIEAERVAFNDHPHANTVTINGVSDVTDYASDNDTEDQESESEGISFTKVIIAGIVLSGFAMFNSFSNNNAPKTSPVTDTQSYSYVTPAQNTYDACTIWANANPTLAAKLQPGQKCYSY